MVDCHYYAGVCLLFGLQWANALCQDVTVLVARCLSKQGLKVLNYIDYFVGGGHLQSMQWLVSNSAKCGPHPFVFIWA